MRNNPGVRLAGDHNECAGCGELFNSTAAFDRHRTGSYGFHGKNVTRRCLTVHEMLAKGMDKNATGWWVTALNPDRGGIPASKTLKNGSCAYGTSQESIP